MDMKNKQDEMLKRTLEIEFLQEKYELSAMQVVTLQMASTFEIYGESYNKLKQEFCK